MAKSPKPAKPLKVYRTATGFHDAYVAAPSRAAALRAWRSDKDLFARGAAEEVTDPALMADALATPGTVVKRLRGTAEEQMAALPPDRPKLAKVPSVVPDAKAKTSSKAKPTALPQPPPRPKPSRAKLDAAEAAVADSQVRHVAALADLTEREAALARERKALEKAQAGEARRLARERDDAADDFAAALERWRG